MRGTCLTPRRASLQDCVGGTAGRALPHRCAIYCPAFQGCSSCIIVNTSSVGMLRRYFWFCDHLHSAWCVAGCTLSTVTVMTAARSSLTLHSYFDGRLCLIRAPRDAATSVNSGYFIVIRCSIQTSGFHGLFHRAASLSPNERQAKRQIGLG